MASLTPQVREIFQKAQPQMSIASWAVRFAASLDGVMMVLSGMSDMAQMKDNTSFMEHMKPLTEEEYKIIDTVCQEMKKLPVIPCTACKYCVEDCPKKINIPALIKIMNQYTVYSGLEGAKGSYERETKEAGKASDCISCKRCMGHCPQHIVIPERMREIAEVFE